MQGKKQQHNHERQHTKITYIQSLLHSVTRAVDNTALYQNESVFFFSVMFSVFSNGGNKFLDSKLFAQLLHDLLDLGVVLVLCHVGWVGLDVLKGGHHFRFLEEGGTILDAVGIERK